MKDQIPSTEKPVKQVMYKLDFNKELFTLDGVPMVELKPSYKGKYTDVTDDDYTPSRLNKLLGRALANSSEDFEGKEFEWYPILYNSGILTLDVTDTRRLKAFIVSKRKGEGAFSNLVIKEFFDVFKKANFTE